MQKIRKVKWRSSGLEPFGDFQGPALPQGHLDIAEPDASEASSLGELLVELKRKLHFPIGHPGQAEGGGSPGAAYQAQIQAFSIFSDGKSKSVKILFAPGKLSLNIEAPALVGEAIFGSKSKTCWSDDCRPLLYHRRNWCRWNGAGLQCDLF